MPRKSETARRNKIKLRDARFEDKKQTKTFSFKPKKQNKMKKLQITIDRVNETVTTFGMIHSAKGNVDGTINFEESGINNEMSDDEIEEYFIEKHEDFDVTVIIEN